MNKNPLFLQYPREAIGLLPLRTWWGILGPFTKNPPFLPRAKDSSRVYISSYIVAHQSGSTTSATWYRSPSWRPAAVSLPNRSFYIKVGVFHGISINDSEDDILKALSDQKVTHARRLLIRNMPGVVFSWDLPHFLQLVPLALHLFEMCPSLQQFLHLYGFGTEIWT